jgi:hypothetical protein
MNKQAQFKVALKRYLNTHFFYSVEEFLTFKNDSISAKVLFVCFVVWTLQNMCILYVKLFIFSVCYIYSILKRYLSEASSYCVCVFLCFVLSAFICMLCIFMTYFTSYCCHYKLRDPRNALKTNSLFLPLTQTN